MENVPSEPTGWSAEEARKRVAAAVMLGDAAENAWMQGEERTIDEHPEPYLCPDILWQGVFASVADIVQRRTWEVWMGTACALGAIAHRNVHAHYHANLYGWMYGLLISPTGTGKSVCTNICRGLLPSDYRISTGVQSGPGLVSVLADVERAKGAVSRVDVYPSILLLPEWTTVAKNLKIQNATLSQDLNTLFDGDDRFTVSRSEASKSGGGRVEIPTPSLSICATTTESLFHEEVTLSMVRSGFLNRYLILPGSHARWQFEDPTSGINYNQLRTVIPPGRPHAFGLGQDVWTLYDQDAHDYVRLWGDALFGQIMNRNGNGEPADDMFRRLHVYAHKIAMLYAWSSSSPLITLSHAMAAKVVVEMSLRYVQQLMADTPPDQPAHLVARGQLEERIVTLVTVASTLVPLVPLTKREVTRKLHGYGGYSTVNEAIERLVKSGELVEIKEGARGTKKVLRVN